MPVLEKYPSATSAVVAGWTNPTNAYAFDNTYAYSETTTAEQEYSGYGNFLTGVEVIDKVFIHLKWKSTITTVNQGDTATGTCTIRVYDGATWQNYQVTAQDLAVSTANDESFVATEGNDTNTATFIDVTPHVTTLTELNSIITRLLFATTFAAGATVRWSVDAVSILVCYHIQGNLYPTGTATTKRDLEGKLYKSVQAVHDYLKATS